MVFSSVFGIEFAIDFVSENCSEFHGFSQTAWKNVLVSKPCQSVESSMTSRQNGLPQFSRNAKNLKKTPKRLPRNGIKKAWKNQYVFAMIFVSREVILDRIKFSRASREAILDRI